MLGNRYSKLHISLGLALICIGIFFPMPSFAQDNGFSQEVFDLLDMIISFISWAWVIPATIAGKLMTNDFIYGQAFYLDRYLWKMWTFMRTMALFMLWFLLLVDILRAYFKQEGQSAIIGAIRKVAIAGIMIPMTWWLMAVIIDISVVATATVSSLPLQVMQQQRNSLSYSITIPKKIEIDSSWKINQQLLASKDNYQPLSLEAIMPQADSIAWPFIFMGAALLKLQESNYVPQELKDRKKLSLASIIKVVILFSFALPLFVLMIVNMMRVFYIRLWIVFSPFLVLDYVYKWPLQQKIEYFKLSNMFGLIFQPVVIVGLLSLGMILVIGISDILLWGQEYQKWSLEQLQVVCGNDSTCIIGPKVLAEITVKGELFQHLGSTVWGIVGEIILIIFVVFLLRALVKAGFETSKLTKWVADGIYKFAGGMMANAQVLPGISWSTLDKAGSWLAGAAKWAMEKKSATQSTNLTKPLESLFGISHIWMSDLNKQQLKEVLDNRTLTNTHRTEAFWNKLRTILGEKEMKWNDRELRASLEEWLKKWGFDELQRVKSDLFTPAQWTEYRADPTKIWSNPIAHKFFDRMLKGGVDANFDDLVRATSGLDSINNETYWARR